MFLLCKVTDHPLTKIRLRILGLRYECISPKMSCPLISTGLIGQNGPVQYYGYRPAVLSSSEGGNKNQSKESLIHLLWEFAFFVLDCTVASDETLNIVVDSVVKITKTLNFRSMLPSAQELPATNDSVVYMWLREELCSDEPNCHSSTKMKIGRFGLCGTSQSNILI